MCINMLNTGVKTCLSSLHYMMTLHVKFIATLASLDLQLPTANVLIALDMENIKTVVQSALPGLTPDIVNTVLTCLQDCGVESVDDLALVEERDLAGCLKPIQIRKLLRSAKPEGKSLEKIIF